MRAKGLILAMAGFAAMAMADPLFAQSMNADDVAWINRCIRDNRGEAGGTPEVVRAYCVCMNEKMDSNETRSVTAWEKANPGARRACEQQSGWK